jgi:Flp pilus assembly protein TadG
MTHPVNLWRPLRRRGATLVEFAVVAPVLFFIVFGIIELSRTFMVKELLTEAARRGARAAIVEGATTSQIQTAAQNCLTTIGISGDQVSISVNDAPLGSVDPSTAAAGAEMTVVVSVPVSKVCWLPSPIFVSGTISGQFTLRRT